MSLSTLFDDFPLFRYSNGVPRCRHRRPLLQSVLDTVDDDVGRAFKIMPALTLNLDDIFEHSSPGKKRKIRDGAMTNYEPKSKVMVSNKDDKLKITLDTSNYQPEEITVKVVDNKIAISAKHEAKDKDVYEYSEMYRSFDLPKNVDPNAITSRLNSSGQLTVEAPLKSLPESTGRTIPVEIEGKSQKSIEASNSPSEDKNQ